MNAGTGPRAILDLEDLRPHVGQQHRGKRPVQDVRQIEHADSAEWSGHRQSPCVSRANGSEPRHATAPDIEELDGDALPDGDGLGGTGDDIADDRHAPARRRARYAPRHRAPFRRRPGRTHAGRRRTTAPTPVPGSRSSRRRESGTKGRTPSAASGTASRPGQRCADRWPSRQPAQNGALSASGRGGQGRRHRSAVSRSELSPHSPQTSATSASRTCRQWARS